MVAWPSICHWASAAKKCSRLAKCLAKATIIWQSDDSGTSLGFGKRNSNRPTASSTMCSLNQLHSDASYTERVAGL